jgi:hypothetical protein
MKKAPQTTVSQASVVELLQRTDLAHWQDVARRVNDPVTARLIVKLLDEDPYLREHRIGVYLAASETVKRSQIRYARWHRYGQAAGAFLRFVRGCARGAAGVLASFLPRAQPSPVAAAAPAGARHEQSDDALVFPRIVDPFVDKAPLVH